MSSISEYIKNVLSEVKEDVKEVEFDIGLTFDGYVNSGSKNRIKFTVVRKKK